MRSRVVALIVPLLVLAACGGDPEKSETSPSASASAEVSATPPPTVALGETVELEAGEGGVATMVVEQYTRDIPAGIASSILAPDERVDAALLYVCNEGIPLEAQQYVFPLTNPTNYHLSDDTSGRYDFLDITPSPAPQPQYDSFVAIAPGDCQRGWLAFQVPTSVEPATLTFSEPSSGVLAEWRLQ